MRLLLPVTAVAGAVGAVTVCVVGLVGLVLVVAGVLVPVAAGWVQPRPAPPDLILGPGLWDALRPLLKIPEEKAGDRRKWLRLPDSLDAGNRVVLRLPAEWPGGEAGTKALDAIVTSRLPGDWDARWSRDESVPWVQWTRRAPEAPRPELPKMVEWYDTGDPYKIYVGETPEGAAFVHTHTATPHVGSSGETGSGKSTIAYMFLVAARLHGWLVTVIDPKRNSLREADGEAGVRIHVDVVECCMALAEYFTSMMAAEKWNSKKYEGRGGLDAPVPRLLIVEEWPSFKEFVAAWWKFIMKERGFPPVLVWIQLVLMQGRSSNHRVFFGTHQFSLEVFGSTLVRDQVGTKMVAGEVSPPSWVVAFGAGAPMVEYDETIPGRGAISLKGRRRKKVLPDGRVERAEEIQYAYITPRVAEWLQKAPPAPDWWTRGEMAPWITNADVARAHAAAAVAPFLPGGAVAGQRSSLTPDTDIDDELTGTHKPSSKPVPDMSGQGAVSGGTAPEDLVELAALVAEEGIEETRYTLRQACEIGIIRKTYGAARQFKSAWIGAGKEFPEGRTEKGATSYTREELEAVYGAPVTDSPEAD
ncbi:hypothetical protein [Streptomyces sp. NPDC059708]|uniref:hypothetical protein n=1 Tax=Streptomyces sp. NPDC059708 TaxID=3346916 RepID=UPI0036C4F32C